jgi:hypothetical protein
MHLLCLIGLGGHGSGGDTGGEVKVWSTFGEEAAEKSAARGATASVHLTASATTVADKAASEKAGAASRHQGHPRSFHSKSAQRLLFGLLMAIKKSAAAYAASTELPSVSGMAMGLVDAPCNSGSWSEAAPPWHPAQLDSTLQLGALITPRTSSGDRGLSLCVYFMCICCRCWGVSSGERGCVYGWPPPNSSFDPTYRLPFTPTYRRSSVLESAGSSGMLHLCHRKQWRGRCQFYSSFLAAPPSTHCPARSCRGLERPLWERLLFRLLDVRNRCRWRVRSLA